MKKRSLILLILVLVFGDIFPVFSQEKDIKMEVFEEDVEVLPFIAVDKNGRTVTDLKKKEIILLINGRNCRDFSLIYPSSRCRGLVVFSDAPRNSCHEIVFPYKSELEKATQIQLGTYRKDVHLRTPDILKTSTPLSKTEGKNEVLALNKEKKLISVRIINPYQRGHWSQANKVRELEQHKNANIKETLQSIPVQSIIPESDLKTNIVKKLKDCQLKLKDSLSINYGELALRYLKLGRVKEALGLYNKLFERSGLNSITAESIRPLVSKIRRIDETSEKLLNEINAFIKTEQSSHRKIVWEKIDVQFEKSNIEKVLSYLQERIDNSRKQIDFAKEVLNQLPVILGINRSAAFQTGKGKPQRYQDRLDFFRSSRQQLESLLLIQTGRIKKILDPIEQIITNYSEQIKLTQRYLKDIENMSDKDYSQQVVDFIIDNSSQFSHEYRTPFFQKKLEMLGAPKELISQSSFFNVITHSRTMRKNDQGFWEGVFSDEITLIYIPQGKFTMGVPWESGGAEDESPEHQVYLDSYWISKYEITFDQYDEFCLEKGKNLVSDYDRGRKNRPVVGISWLDTRKFCRWLSEKTGLYFTLPTEAQWEKAARGTNAWKYPWGNNDPDGDCANFADEKFLKKYLQLNPPLNEKDRQQKTGWIDSSNNDGYAFTAPVGSFPEGASPYGVMDMSGNVWEWVLDWYDSDYYQRSPVRNPAKISSGTYRVSRGGGWDCHSWLLRITGRAGGDPSKGNDSLGFRIVCINNQRGSSLSEGISEK